MAQTSRHQAGAESVALCPVMVETRSTIIALQEAETQLVCVEERSSLYFTQLFFSFLFFVEIFAFLILHDLVPSNESPPLIWLFKKLLSLFQWKVNKMLNFK